MNELIGKIILDRYRIDKFLGRGGMAEVYKVWDTHRNAWLAMKVLHADLALDHAFLRRFKREAQTLERLQHPNIVRFYGLERQNRFVFMLMDYVDGESLKPKIFDAQGPLPFEQIYSITRELAWALKYAHSEGYVHSDVKPGNIMLDDKGHVMLSDFGIARMTDSSTMTMIGAGTPAYMAPEQIRGEAPTIQTDIYSLGIVLYEMLTGERPFNGELATISGTVGEKVRWEQLNLQVPSPSRLNKKITPELEDLVLRALAKDKHERFHDVGELLAEFSQVFQDDAYRQASVFSEREQKETPEAIKKEKRDLEGKARLEKEADAKAKRTALRQRQQERAVDSDKLFSKMVKRLVLISAGMALLMSFGYIISHIEVLAKSEPTKIPTILISPLATLALPTSTVEPTKTPTPTSIPLTPTPAYPTGSTMKSEIDGMTMAYIPPGDFEMGGSADDIYNICEMSYSVCGDPQEYDETIMIHTVYLDGYWIDQTEVTNYMYYLCVLDGGCSEPDERSSDTRDSYYKNPEFNSFPMINVSWKEARNYCAWAGRRLPTEAEWEKAARGGLENQLFPWGDSYPVCKVHEINGANFWDTAVGSRCYYPDTKKVGSFAPNGYGVYDMAGNVSEWVSDWYADNYYAISPNSNPLGPESGKYRVIRGGDWKSYGYKELIVYLRVRSTESPNYTTGFRCAMDAD